MAQSERLTTREVGELLGQPTWRIRRVVDSLKDVERFGGKRVVRRSALPKIFAELQKRGWLSEDGAAVQ